jgi:outer membrane protein assembly factor BamB
VSWLNLRSVSCLALAVALVAQSLFASDWSRFRGPNGSGISPDTAPAPTKWSDTENLKWKVKLPGPGSSSPIIVGKKVFVTCWSGYAMEARSAGGDVKNLKRHLVCLDRADGKVLWDKSVPAVMPEEEYRGMFAENGYASHTPCSDGEHVYVFFGKSGVLAYDLDGNELWHKSVGTQDDPRSWGTASSPIVYQNLVIVPATIESSSLIALDKSTGDVVWKKEANGFGSTWGTPVLAKNGDKTEIVFGVTGEIWSFQPSDGKLLWYCPYTDEQSMCSSVVTEDGTVFAIEGRSGGSVAVKTGGSKDVSKTNVLWNGSDRGRIGTPLVFDHRLYWITGGVANCIDAKTGEKIYQSRVGTGGGGALAGGPGGDAPRPGPGGGRPGGFGGGGRGGMGGQDYSSPVAADGKLYYITRAGETYVVPLQKEFKLLATNRFESDKSGYSATPAISDGELFIRSNTHLYCVSEKK